jgi:hypothetical protein
MNRNLLIAIAAVAVVGIAAGILLAGQTGQLSGAIGPTPTTLTLNASTCSVPSPSGNVSFTLSGELRDSAGNPLAGRTVALRWAVCDNGPCATGPQMPLATTDQNGGFSFARNEPPTRNYDADTYVQYGAAFSGDAQYAGCSSDLVRKLC